MLLTKYLKKAPNKKLNFIMTDTTFIQNKNGNNMIGYNKFYNRKNGTKISIICDVLGIPLDTSFYKGLMNDSKILMNQLNNNTQINNLDYNGYQMADKGYYTNEIINTLTDKGFCPLIAPDKRNIKNELLIRKMSKDEKIINLNRQVIERRMPKFK